MKLYEVKWFSGPGDTSKMGLVSHRNSLWTHKCFLSGSESIWIYTFLPPEINQRWVLPAITHPINVYGVGAVLKQNEFAWLSGLGSQPKMSVVSCPTPYRCIRLLDSFEQVWIHMVVWAREYIEDGSCEISEILMHWHGFCTDLEQYQFIWLSGPGNKSKMGPVSYQTSFKLYTPFEPLWSNMNWYGFLGPETNRRWALWAISKPYQFLRRLNSFDTVWIHVFVGARKYIKDKSCELSDSL